MNGPRIVCVCCNKPLRSLRWGVFCRAHSYDSDAAAAAAKKDRDARERQKRKRAEKAAKLERIREGSW